MGSIFSFFATVCVADAQRRNGQLRDAVLSGNVAQIRRLHERGADVGGADATMMHRAAFHGNTEVLRVLHSLGANVNAVNDDGETPLHIAVRRWTEAACCVATLVELGANVDDTDPSGHTAMHYAAKRGNESALRMLHSLGANINAVNTYRQTSLYFAVRGTETARCIPTLVELGANVSHSDQCGDTVLHLAARRGNAEALRMTLRRGEHQRRQ